jgi:hypothetical protein
MNHDAFLTFIYILLIWVSFLLTLIILSCLIVTIYFICNESYLFIRKNIHGVFFSKDKTIEMLTIEIEN